MDCGRKLVDEKLLMDENRLVRALFWMFIVSACHTLIHVHRGTPTAVVAADMECEHNA